MKDQTETRQPQGARKRAAWAKRGSNQPHRPATESEIKAVHREVERYWNSL